MRENSLTGAFGVFSFTLTQSLKSKTVQITIMILGLIALLSMPLLSLISSDEKTSNDVSSIKVLYIVDESKLPTVDYSGITKENERFSGVFFQYVDLPIDTVRTFLEEEVNNALLHLTIEEGYYRLKFYRSSNSSYTDVDLSMLGTLMQNTFRMSSITAEGITDANLNELNSPISRKVVINDKNVFESDSNTLGLEEENISVGANVTQRGRLSMNEYYLILALFVVTSMFFAFGGEGVASSIITEKSTRVIEYLLITIRPMGLIVGKVLAMLVVNLIELGTVVTGILLSLLLKKAMYPNDDMLPGILKNIFTKELVMTIDPLKIIVAIFIFIGGFLFFAFLAGFVGSCVSKIEELGEGMMLYTLVLLIGAYLSLAVIIMDMNSTTGSGLSLLAYLLPISSVFITPIYIILGKVSVIWGIASILILIISIGLLIYFMSMVYEALIMHRGNRIKLKEVVQLLKVKKRGIYHERT